MLYDYKNEKIIAKVSLVIVALYYVFYFVQQVLWSGFLFFFILAFWYWLPPVLLPVFVMKFKPSTTAFDRAVKTVVFIVSIIPSVFISSSLILGIIDKIL